MPNQPTSERTNGSANQCPLPCMPAADNRSRRRADGSASQRSCPGTIRSSIGRFATRQRHRSNQAQTKCIALHIIRLDANYRIKFKIFQEQKSPAKTGTSVCNPGDTV